MSDTQPSQPAPSDVSRMSRERFHFLLLLLVAAVAAGYFYLKAKTATSDVQVENAELKRQNANIQTRLDELEAHQLLLKQERELKQSRLHAAGTKAKEAAAAIDALQRKMTAWRAANEQLRSTDQRKRLASDPELLAQYHALASQARPGPTLPVDLRARLKPLQTLIDEATQANNPLFSPAEQLESQLASIQGEAQQGSKLYGDHNQQLQAILARLPAAPTAQALALDEALKALETKHANDRTRRLAEELDKARRENTEKDAQAQAENERRLAQVEGEAKRKLADVEAQRAHAEAKRKAPEIGRDTQAEKDLAEENRRKKKEQEEEARLEREFQNDWPEIQAMLKPLLDPAYTQPVKAMQPRVTTTKGPVSLGAVRATGAFAEDQTGLYELQRAIYYDRDRNKGRWPRLEDKEFFIKARRYLLKYGNLMVKKGLFAP